MEDLTYKFQNITLYNAQHINIIKIQSNYRQHLIQKNLTNIIVKIVFSNIDITPLNI